MVRQLSRPLQPLPEQFHGQQAKQWKNCSAGTGHLVGQQDLSALAPTLHGSLHCSVAVGRLYEQWSHKAEE
eukprot:2575757-Lingulodinium_polyedra.AAC.1